mgnify:CR=1 FL=1
MRSNCDASPQGCAIFYINYRPIRVIFLTGFNIFVKSIVDIYIFVLLVGRLYAKGSFRKSLMPQIVTVSEAVTVSETYQPEFAILDVMLPDGNGFNLMERLKKAADYPVLFLTAAASMSCSFAVSARCSPFFMTSARSKSISLSRSFTRGFSAL